MWVPSAAYRISGSWVSRPLRSTRLISGSLSSVTGWTLSLVRRFLGGGGELGIDLGLSELRRHVHDGEDPHHRLVESQPPLDLLHHHTGPLVEQQGVDPVALAVNLVREAPLAPALDLEHFASQLLDPARHPVDLVVDPPLVQTGLQDEGGLVLVHVSSTSLRALRLNRFLATSRPSPIQHSTASAARASASASVSSSSRGSSSSTCSPKRALSEAPTPILSRAYSRVPSVPSMLSSPW